MNIPALSVTAAARRANYWSPPQRRTVAAAPRNARLVTPSSHPSLYHFHIFPILHSHLIRLIPPLHFLFPLISFFPSFPTFSFSSPYFGLLFQFSMIILNHSLPPFTISFFLTLQPPSISRLLSIFSILGGENALHLRLLNCG